MIEKQISELELRPAHLTQSAEASSLDAWLEGLNYYRRPERSISYYNKGELLGIMLDLAIGFSRRQFLASTSCFGAFHALAKFVPLPALAARLRMHTAPSMIALLEAVPGWC